MKWLLGKSLVVKRKEIGTLVFTSWSQHKSCPWERGVGGKPKAEIWKGHVRNTTQTNAASKTHTEQLWR